MKDGLSNGRKRRSVPHKVLMRFQRRRILKRASTALIAVIASATLALSGCSGSDGDAPDSESGSSALSELIIYSAEEAAQDFADKYMAEVDSSMKITVLAGSSGENNARVVAEGGNPQGDLSFSGSDPAQSNPELYDIASEVIDLSGIDQRFIANEHAVTSFVYPLIFAYNSDQLNGDEPPATWQELADPKWEGRIYMGNPASSEAAYKAMVTLWTLGGWELVERVAANAIITEGSIDPMRALGNSEAAIGIGVENQIYKWADGELVVAVYPTDGMIMHLGTQYLISNGPNPESAAAFMSWLLSSEIQGWVQDEYVGMRSSLADAPTPSNVPATDTLEILEFADEAQEGRAEFVEQWQEIITSL